MGFLKRSAPEEAFWKWFTRHSDDYFRLDESNRDRLFSTLGEQLEKIDENLTFEFSAKVIDGKREFVISADGVRTAFPAVIKLVEQAPSLDTWKVTAFRQRSGPINLQMGNITLSGDTVFFGWEPTKDGLLNVTVYIPGFQEGDAQMINAVYILLDSLLGEYDVETRLAHIQFACLDEANKSRLYPLDELPETVDRMTIQ